MDLLGDPPPWTKQSRCLDAEPETFFPDKGGSTRNAKAICADCPVREPCLEYALTNDERFGIWGGKSERERRRMRRSGNSNVISLHRATERKTA